MKVVILAGGQGTRLSEETTLRPKPLIEIGEQPILWHIMKMYSSHGLNDFLILLGYKGYMIKEYFASYVLRHADVTFDLGANAVEMHDGKREPWRVTLIDTGPTTNHGGRIGRVRDIVGDEAFCLAYGDTVSNVDVTSEIAFHREHGRVATMTVAQPPGRFGAVYMHEGRDEIETFREKPDGDGAWVNGGFFVLEPTIMDYIDGDATDWGDVLQNVAHDGELVGFRHDGFWHPMDTLPDKTNLERYWSAGDAPWKTW